MNLKNNTLTLSLFIPILSLMILTAFKHWRMISGREITLPITAYDPRDLLSGHYLRYTVNYGISSICESGKSPLTTYHTPNYICLEPPFFSQKRPFPCTFFIKGQCHNGRFTAGIEQFFIPEDKAKQLEKMVQNKKASILLSISTEGDAIVKELLIEGKPWHEQLLSP
jgi:uncharacterized membrane-anchored protein